MFHNGYWVWLWVIMLLLNTVGAFRAFRRADRLTLRQSVIAAAGALCLIVSCRVPAASTALTGIGITCLVASNLDGLLSGKSRAA